MCGVYSSGSHSVAISDRIGVVGVIQGVSLLAVVSEEQVDAMAGGPILLEFYTLTCISRDKNASLTVVCGVYLGCAACWKM